jgi:putative addiction module CopG family antidote
MSISLTPDQERFIQTKLQAGKYRSAQEVLEIALRLLMNTIALRLNGWRMCEKKLMQRSLDLVVLRGW